MRRVLLFATLAAVVLVGAYFSAARRTTGPPLDPTSTASDGTKAVVELVGRLGGSIEVVDEIPGPDVSVALLLEDRLERAASDDLLDWVRAGGTLVVADPGSLFTPAVGPGVLDGITGSCTVTGLEDVQQLFVGVSRTYAVDGSSVGCFGPTADNAFVVATPQGTGRIVAVGGTDVFTNELLDEGDNAVLVAGLLVGPGDTGARGDATSAAFLRPAIAGGGDQGLLDLIGTPVWAGLAQLVIAFGLVVAWRARRLGQPVAETQAVRIEASELTRAVGRLLENNRRPDRAAAVLRDHSRRDLSGPLGLALDAPVDVVVATLAVHTTLTEPEIRRAVTGPVASDDQLVDVAALLARIREEITHDRSNQLTP